jgi:hypothetical protein
MDQSRWIVVIALVSIVVVGTVFVASYDSARIVETLSAKLLIAIWNKTATNSSLVGIPKDVGVPGGIFGTTRYMSDGVYGYYPVWARHYGNTIWVDSRVQRNYTLGDFFELWGVPLGPLDTLGYRENVTTFRGNLTSTTYLFFWSMCLVDPHASTNSIHIDDAWGSHVLRDNETITLTYATEACASVGGGAG